MWQAPALIKSLAPAGTSVNSEPSACVRIDGNTLELSKKEILQLRAQLNDALKEIEKKEEALFLAKNLKLF